MLALYPKVAIFAALTSAQTCYHPDHTTASTAVPCSADNSTCCEPGSICLSSGYCLSDQPGCCAVSRLLHGLRLGRFLRGYLVNYRTGDDAPLTSIGLNDDGRAIYCCGYGSDSGSSTSTTCADGDAPFVLEDGEIIYSRAALADVNTNSTDSDSCPTADPTAGGSSGDDPGSHCSSNDTAIGPGVGVPLGVLALSAVAWALWERRRRRQSVCACACACAAIRVLYAPAAKRSDGVGSVYELEWCTMIQGTPCLTESTTEDNGS
ncbi:hypothetical protein BJX99DRAFT_252994 [Aspergillus californicus]